GRLREDCRVAGTTAATGRAAATLKQRQLDIALPRQRHELLLRAVDLPAGCERPTVLARVRVADHHLLRRTRSPVEKLGDERAVRDPVAAVLAQGCVEQEEIDEQRRAVGVAIVREPSPNPYELSPVRLRGVADRQLGSRADQIGRHPPRLAQTPDLALVELAR